MPRHRPQSPKYGTSGVLLAMPITHKDENAVDAVISTATWPIPSPDTIGEGKKLSTMIPAQMQ